MARSHKTVIPCHISWTLTMRTITIVLIALLFAVSSCTLSTPVPQATPPFSLALTESPEPLFTATPDSNLFTISAEIDQNYSQEEIAKILFSKWLNHFLSEKVSPKMRLDEYIINKINIPFDQRCAKELGGTFIAEAEVTAKTFLPLVSTTDDKRSDWFVAGGGNIIDPYHQLRFFSSVMFQSEDTYTLLVITQIPMCE